MGERQKRTEGRGGHRQNVAPSNDGEYMNRYEEEVIIYREEEASNTHGTS